jgi:hypothetical protein
MAHTPTERMANFVAAWISEGFVPGRNPETFASSFALASPRNSLLSPSGAVMSRFLSWFMA